MYEDISFRGIQIRSRAYYITYTASAIFHVLFFAAFIFMPELGRQQHQMPQSISVSLVSLPGPPELSGLKGSPGEENKAETAPATVMEDDTEVEVPKPPEPVQPEEPEPAPEPVPEPEPEPAEPPPQPIEPVIEPKETVAIPDAPEKKEKPEVKPEKSDAPKLPAEQIVTKKRNPQTQKPKDVQKEVVKPAEAKRREEASRSESIKDAVDRIRQSVGKRSAQSGAGRSGSGGDGGNSTSRGRPGGGPGGEIGSIYGQQLAYHIQQNWAFSPSLAGGRRDLLSILRITILSDGHIAEIDFEQRSGNNYLDESAYRAVMKSDPLPPPPGGASEYTVGVRFTPDGLN